MLFRSSDPALDRLLDFAAEVGLVVLLHNDVDRPFARKGEPPVFLAQFKELLSRHPKNSIIWAHIGLGRVMCVRITYLGELGYELNIPTEQAKMRSCVLTSRFARNSEMVWRVRVHDPKSGDALDDKALKSVEVTVAGKTIAAKFGPHPKEPPNELFWTASWVIPKDQATGTLKYSALATGADGRIGKFEPFPTAPSLPAVIDEVLVDAPAKA